MLLAALVAVLHGAAVAFLLSGSLLALRWPRLLWLHVPVSLAILGLYVTGSDCPLTTLELWLRERAGEPGYRGGFIGHYLTEPLGFPIHATSTQVAIYVLAFTPNAVGYGLLAARRHARLRTSRFTRPSERVGRLSTKKSRRKLSPCPTQQTTGESSARSRRRWNSSLD